MIGMGWFPDRHRRPDPILPRTLRGASASRASTRARSCRTGGATRPPGFARSPAHAQPLTRAGGRASRARAAAARPDGRRALRPLCRPRPFRPRPLRRRPVVVHFHGPWADEALRRAGIARREGQARHRAPRLPEGPIASWLLSHAFRGLLVESLRRLALAHRRDPPGVDLGHFSPGDGVDRDRLGVADDAWLAVAARRLVPRMGLDVLLRAWARRRRDDARTSRRHRRRAAERARSRRSPRTSA